MFSRTTPAIAITAIVLGASAAADASFILDSSLGAVDADARINSLTILTPTPDDLDPDIIPWDDSTLDGAGSGANSASASAGQTIFDWSGDSFSGEGSSNASAIADSQNDAAAHGLSGYVLAFTVDAPMKIDLDWDFFANSTGSTATFDIGWTMMADAAQIAGVEVDETDPSGDWAQSDSYSLNAQPGVEYEFAIGSLTLARAGTTYGTPFAATAGLWNFTFTVPTPASMSLMALAGFITLRRRR